jgi:hypothetical protein
MSARDEHDAAVRTLRRAAASQLARREAQEATARKLREALERIEAGAASAAPREEVAAQLERAEAELSASQADLDASLDALRDAQKLGRHLERAELLREVRAASGVEPLSPAARALDNARAGIRELEATAAEDGQPSPETEDRDARARAELERLKAARRAAGGDRAQKPKRTL